MKITLTLPQNIFRDSHYTPKAVGIHGSKLQIFHSFLAVDGSQRIPEGPGQLGDKIIISLSTRLI